MPKTYRPNPMGSDWDNMSHEKDFFIVNQNHTVGSVAHRFDRRTPDGQSVHHAKPGEALSAGQIFPVKNLGPGVDVQRLVDLGAIREAFPYEVETYRSAFGEDANMISENVDESSKAALQQRDPEGSAPHSGHPGAQGPQPGQGNQKGLNLSEDMKSQRPIDEAKEEGKKK